MSQNGRKSIENMKKETRRYYDSLQKKNISVLLERRICCKIK